MSGRAGAKLGWAIALAVLLLAAAGAYLLHRERRRSRELPYQYDMDSIREVRPDLIYYRETARMPTGLKTARGIATGAGDRILVTGDSEVVILGSDGKRLGGFAVKGRPGPVATDGDDVFLGLGTRLAVYSSSGQHRADWTGLGEKAVITSIAVEGDDVFIADYGNRIVWRFDRGWALRARIGEKDEARGIPGFIVPSPVFDVVVAPGKGLWAANPGRRRLELYDREGKLLRSWGRASVRIKVYTSEGKLSAVVAAPGHFGETALPLDVAVDSAGRILALDPRGMFVRVFEKIGEKTQ
ncbi:MAG: NHL repeat-containing protein [Planctomycetota bacterium]|jgi:hypothetical protein